MDVIKSNQSVGAFLPDYQDRTYCGRANCPLKNGAVWTGESGADSSGLFTFVGSFLAVWQVRLVFPVP